MVIHGGQVITAIIIRVTTAGDGHMAITTGILLIMATIIRTIMDGVVVIMLTITGMDIIMVIITDTGMVIMMDQMTTITIAMTITTIITDTENHQYLTAQEVMILNKALITHLLLHSKMKINNQLV
jgi:hypothetical protein